MPAGDLARRICRRLRRIVRRIHAYVVGLWLVGSIEDSAEIAEREYRERWHGPH